MGTGGKSTPSPRGSWREQQVSRPKSQHCSHPVAAGCPGPAACPPKAVGRCWAPPGEGWGAGSPCREGAGSPGARGAPGRGPSQLGNKEELKLVQTGLISRHSWGLPRRRGGPDPAQLRHRHAGDPTDTAGGGCTQPGWGTATLGSPSQHRGQRGGDPSWDTATPVSPERAWGPHRSLRTSREGTITSPAGTKPPWGPHRPSQCQQGGDPSQHRASLGTPRDTLGPAGRGLYPRHGHPQVPTDPRGQREGDGRLRHSRPGDPAASPGSAGR